ncbi:AI-2E family transporter [uncultured Albimonas sp.]|uniref:AI-2E family transporter n=1 Tax=uncultured Albimonas sp. TaxID=1331701 RepID=UPI0030EDC4C1
MKGAPLLNLVLAVVLTMAVGQLLVIGRPILVPIITAVISVYLMSSATEALRRAPVLRHLPSAALRALVLLIFALGLYAFAVVVASTIGEIAGVAPGYQQNFEALADRLEQRFDVDMQKVLDDAFRVTFGGMDLRAVILGVLGGFTSVGSTAFLVVIYAAFLMVEQPGFPAKLSAALGDPQDARDAAGILSQINARIGEYLAVKTLINLILGGLCLGILLAMGSDFALFWAIVIALLNYIPYVGSLLGVAFPVLLSVAQEGSVGHSLALAAMLIAAQISVGNVLEPRMIGRQLNLSPFAVMAALSVWSAIWGLAGAILAVPMTAMLVIVLEHFPATRFLAVLMWNEVPPQGAAPRPESPDEARG